MILKIKQKACLKSVSVLCDKSLLIRNIKCVPVTQFHYETFDVGNFRILKYSFRKQSQCIALG